MQGEIILSLNAAINTLSARNPLCYDSNSNNNDVKDSAGNYIKSMCLIFYSKNYDQAKAKCESMQMQLLVVDSTCEKAVFDGIKPVYNSQWEDVSGVALRVEGRTGGECNADGECEAYECNAIVDHSSGGNGLTTESYGNS